MFSEWQQCETMNIYSVCIIEHNCYSNFGMLTINKEDTSKSQMRTMGLNLDFEAQKSQAFGTVAEFTIKVDAQHQSKLQCKFHGRPSSTQMTPINCIDRSIMVHHVKR